MYVFVVVVVLFTLVFNYLVRVLTDDNCCTGEGTPPSYVPSAWLNAAIMLLVGGVYKIFVLPSSVLFVSVLRTSSALELLEPVL